MSLSDPIADMLTRIRNAARVSREYVNVRASNVCAGIAAVLKEQGYVEDVDRVEDGKQGLLRIKLKYDADGRSVIEQIRRVSRPGQRVYAGVDDLPRVMGGMGTTIVSTSRGVLSDKSCRKEKLGGEILCTVC